MTRELSPLLFERYELKFHIRLDQIEEISQYVEMFCELDHFSKISEDNYYTVNNIYLDSPNFLFLEKRKAGIDNRFNLRIRSYGENPKPPYFFEVKHKTKGIVKKKRAKIMDENWSDELNHKVFNESTIPVINNQSNYKEQFIGLVQSYNAGPKIFTQYRRKAYASFIDDYARVTFDKDLRYMRTEEYNLSPDELSLSHYDHTLNFKNTENNIILELKCTTQVPIWFLDLISYFNLERASFSKYAAGVGEIQGDYYIPEITRVPNFAQP